VVAPHIWCPGFGARWLWSLDGATNGRGFLVARPTVAAFWWRDQRSRLFGGATNGRGFMRRDQRLRLFGGATSGRGFVLDMPLWAQL